MKSNIEIVIGFEQTIFLLKGGLLGAVLPALLEVKFTAIIYRVMATIKIMHDVFHDPNFLANMQL